MAKRSNRSKSKAMKLRLLKTLHKREQRNPPLEPPPEGWFNGDARRLLRSLIKNKYVTDGKAGVRLTAKGRSLVSGSATHASDNSTNVDADDKANQ